MVGEQAAGVWASVRRDVIEGRGDSWSEEDELAFKKPISEKFEQQSHPLYASARLWDDGIIKPEDTRKVLAMSLRASLIAPLEDTSFGVFRM